MAECRTALQQLGRLAPNDTPRATRPAAEEAGSTAEAAAADARSPQPTTPHRQDSNLVLDQPRTPEPFSPNGKCSRCGSVALALVSKPSKPSWREIPWREGDTCPPWYAELQREEHRLYCTETYGADIYDCYMQMLVESAEEEAPPMDSQPATLSQPLLPSLTLVTPYETIPF